MTEVQRKKLEYYFSLSKSSEKLPDCLEKCLINLMYLTQVKLFKEKIEPLNNQSKTNLEEEIKKNFILLQNRFKIEDSDSEKNVQSIKSIENNINSEKWLDVQNDVEKILNEKRILNMIDIRELNSKTQSTGATINNKDIVLLLGPTGSGKSTLIHFLAGSKLEKVKKNGINHLQPVANELYPSIVNTITTSPFAKSETRSINSVSILYKNIGINQEGSLILCDSPGLSDTDGIEADIVNGISIVKALHQAKSVKPIVIVSEDSTANRMEGFLNLADQLSVMVNNVSFNVKKFSFIFNKFPEEKKEDLAGRLINLREEISQRKSNLYSEQAKLFLDEMCIKIGLGPVFIDPVRSNKEEVIDFINRAPSIENPRSVFNFTISGRAKERIELYFSKHESTLMPSIKYNDYEFIELVLSDIKFLKELLIDFNDDTYSKCVNKIIAEINRKNDTETNYFEDLVLKTDKNLTLKDIERFKVLIKTVRQYDSLRSLHLNGKILSFDIVSKQPQKLFSQLAEHVNIKPLEEYKALQVSTNKLDLIAEHFQLKDLCENVLKTVQSKFFNLLEQLKSYSIKSEFKECADLFDLFEKSALALKNVISFNVDDFLSQLEEIFFVNLEKNSQVETVKKYLNLDRYLLKNEINQINVCVHLLDTSRQEMVKIPNVNKFTENLLAEINDKLIKLFVKICSQTKSIAENIDRDDFNEIGKLVDQATQLKSLAKNDSLYFETIESVSTAFKSIIKDIEISIKQLDNQSTDFKRLAKNMSNLSQCKCLESTKQNLFNNSVKTNSKLLVGHLTNEETQIKALDFYVDKIINNEVFVKCNEKIKKIHETKPLIGLIDELKMIMDRVNDWFDSKIKTILNDLKNDYKKVDFISFDLKKADNILGFLKLSDNIKSIEFESILYKYSRYLSEELSKHLKEIQNYFFNHLNDNSKLSQTIKDVEKFFKILKELEQKRYAHLANNYFQAENISLFTKYTRVFNKFQNDILENINRENSLQKLRLEIKTLNSLSQLDETIEKTNNKFTKLHDRLLKKYTNMLTNKKKTFDESISSFNFKYALDLMNEIVNIDETIFKENKINLNNKVTELITQTENMFAIIDENLDLVLLKSNLSKLSEANALKSYFENVNRVDDFIQKLKNTLTAFLDQQMNKIESLVNNNDLTNVASALKNLKKQMTMLEKFYSDTCKIREKEINKKYESKYESIETEFRTKSMEDLNFYHFKFLREKLKEDEDQFSELIIEKLEQGIKKLPNDADLAKEKIEYLKTLVERYLKGNSLVKVQNYLDKVEIKPKPFARIENLPTVVLQPNQNLHNKKNQCEKCHTDIKPGYFTVFLDR